MVKIRLFAPRSYNFDVMIFSTANTTPSLHLRPMAVLGKQQQGCDELSVVVTSFSEQTLFITEIHCQDIYLIWYYDEKYMNFSNMLNLKQVIFSIYIYSTLQNNLNDSYSLWVYIFPTYWNHKKTEQHLSGKSLNVSIVNWCLTL